MTLETGSKAAGAQEIFTSVGSQFIEFETKDIYGNEVSNETLRGKPSLIVFFGTRCPPCRREIEALDNALSPLHFQKMNLIAIGSTDNNDGLLKFKTKKNYHFQFIQDPDQEYFDQVGDHTIPRTYLLDENGIIISQTVGFYKTPFNNLLKTMSKLISE